MSSFIKFIIFCLLGLASAYVNIKFGSEISNFFFLYIKIDHSILNTYKDSTISILGNNPYIDIIWGSFLVLGSLLPLIFYREDPISIQETKLVKSFKEYIILPAFFVVSIWCFILFLKGFSLILEGLAILLYLSFNIVFFIEHNPIWVLGIIFSLPGFVLIGYFYDKNKDFLLKTKEIIKTYIFIIFISLISLLYFIKPEPIYFGYQKLCHGDQCYLYSDIKDISMDYSSYELTLILKSFNTKLPIIFSRGDMFYKEECDSDGDDGGHSWCWLIHKPILDINDRLTFIVQEEKEDDGRISSEELAYFGEQKNFEKTLNAVISGKISYPDTLSQDWIKILSILNKKTNLYPKIINSK